MIGFSALLNKEDYKFQSEAKSFIRIIYDEWVLCFHLKVENMNPIGYYIQTNEEVKKWIDNYIKDNIDRVQDRELREDVEAISKCDNSI